jgi:hypothetical protein
MKKVDFIVIGAAKSGTTWLWKVLKNHPQCFLPERKEINFFNIELQHPVGNRQNSNFNKPLAWYQNHFSNADPCLKWGEVSPMYLCSETAPDAIFNYNPDIRLIALLRNPVERVYSDYHHKMRMGTIRKNEFEAVIDRYPFIVERSMYGRLLKRYLDRFPRKNIKIILYDDLKIMPDQVVREIENFIGIDHHDDNPVISEWVNVAIVPRFQSINYSLGMIRKLLVYLRLLDVIRRSTVFHKINAFFEAIKKRNISRKAPDKINPESRELLRKRFAQDILLLEKETRMDLKMWLS